MVILVIAVYIEQPPSSFHNFRQNMSSRAAAGLKHRLSTVSSLFSRAPNPSPRSSNCVWGSTNRPLAQVLGREREAEAGKGYARVYRSEWPDSFLERTGKPHVSERKLIENLQEKAEDVDFSQKPHLCTPHHTDEQEYFSVFTLDQDSNFSPKYDIFPPAIHYKFCLCSSSGGLFCYVSWEEGRVLLWNPTTHEFKLLPRPDSFVEPPPPGVTENNHLHWNILQWSGIWFDPQSQDYTVFIYYLLDIEDEDHQPIDLTFAFELYSLKSKSWTKVPCPDYNCVSLSHVCINGIFYTIASCNRGNGIVLLSFDLSTKMFSSFPLPPVTDRQICTLMEYNGLLSMLVAPPDRSRSSLELWVMVNGSWVRESIFYTDGVYKPLCFWRNGELLFLHSLDGELLMFDRATGKLKHLGVRMARGSPLQQFSENFVELNGG